MVMHWENGGHENIFDYLRKIIAANKLCGGIVLTKK